MMEKLCNITVSHKSLCLMSNLNRVIIDDTAQNEIQYSRKHGKWQTTGLHTVEKTGIQSNTVSYSNNKKIVLLFIKDECATLGTV